MTLNDYPMALVNLLQLFPPSYGSRFKFWPAIHIFVSRTKMIKDMNNENLTTWLLNNVAPAAILY